MTAVILAALVLPGATALQAQTASAPALSSEESPYTIVRVAGDASSVVVAPAGQPPLQIQVDSGDREAMKRYRPGDRIVAALRDGRLFLFRPQTENVATRAGWTALAVALLLIGSTSILLRSAGRSALALFKGTDGRYSNSQFQAVVWFGAMILVYLTSFVVRWTATRGTLTSGPEIPQNLIMLSGLSAITFVGAKTITESKIRAAMDGIEKSQVGRAPGPPANAVVAAALPRPMALRREAEHRVKPQGPSRFPQDLLCDDSGRPDFGDTQMLLITVIAVCTYLAQAFHWLGTLELVSVTRLPDVESTILAVFGLGQGAYLVKKGVTGNGAD